MSVRFKAQLQAHARELGASHAEQRPELYEFLKVAAYKPARDVRKSAETNCPRVIFGLIKAL